MNLDYYTLSLSIAVVTALQIAVLFLQSGRNRAHPGIALIAAAYCVLVCGFLITPLFEAYIPAAPLGASVALLVHLGVIGLNVGVARLVGYPVRTLLLSGVFLVFVVSQAIYLAADSLLANQMGNMFGLAAYTGLASFDILRRPREPSAVLIGILFAGPALLCASRLILLLVSGSDGTTQSPGPLFGLLYFVGLIFGLLFSFSVITLVNERNNAALQRTRDELEEARDKAREALRESQRDNDAKTRFLATMSHELRTPMHGILGMVRHVMESTPGAEEQTWLRRVVGAGEHLLEIINDMLDFAKLDAGRAAIRSEPLDIVKLVRDIYEIAVTSATQKELSLLLEGELSRPLWIQGDAARIRQILLNLVGNSVKFTKEGTVTIHLLPEEERIMMRVSDTGPGIAEKDRELIFKPFYQVDETSTRAHGGTGLGLPLSRELARRMGGDLRVESQVEGGSIFEFSLPRVRAAAPEHASGAARAMHALQGRVLLVEDNEDAARLALLMLNKMGLRASRAENGAPAVEMFREQSPDIILMDNHMPIMDGLAATRRIRSLERDLKRDAIPIIGITADAFEDDRRSCLAAGMNEHLAKPFRREQLWNVLARYLPEKKEVELSNTPGGDTSG